MYNVYRGGHGDVLNATTQQKKNNKHCITARKDEETLSLQHMFLAP